MHENATPPEQLAMPRTYRPVIGPDGWLRAHLVAKLLDVSRSTVAAMCADGRLDHRQEEPGAAVWIDPRSVARLVIASGGSPDALRLRAKLMHARALLEELEELSLVDPPTAYGRDREEREQ